MPSGRPTPDWFTSTRTPTSTAFAFGGSGLGARDWSILTRVVSWKIGTDAENPLEVEIEADHPIFDGIGDEGDRFEIRADDDASQSMVAFDDYSGTTVGSAVEDGEVSDGIVAFSEDEQEVLLGIGADGAEQSFADHTDDALQLIANGVASVSDAVTADSEGSTRTVRVAVP